MGELVGDGKGRGRRGERDEGDERNGMHEGRDARFGSGGESAGRLQMQTWTQLQTKTKTKRASAGGTTTRNGRTQTSETENQNQSPNRTSTSKIKAKPTPKRAKSDRNEPKHIETHERKRTTNATDRVRRNPFATPPIDSPAHTHTEFLAPLALFDGLGSRRRRSRYRHAPHSATIVFGGVCCGIVNEPQSLG